MRTGYQGIQFRIEMRASDRHKRAINSFDKERNPANSDRCLCTRLYRSFIPTDSVNSAEVHQAPGSFVSRQKHHPLGVRSSQNTHPSESWCVAGKSILMCKVGMDIYNGSMTRLIVSWSRPCPCRSRRRSWKSRSRR